MQHLENAFWNGKDKTMPEPRSESRYVIEMDKAQMVSLEILESLIAVVNDIAPQLRALKAEQHLRYVIEFDRTGGIVFMERATGRGIR